MAGIETPGSPLVAFRYEPKQVWLANPVWYTKPVHVMLRLIGVCPVILGCMGRSGRAAVDQLLLHLRAGVGQARAALAPRPELLDAYLFRSQARGDAGPLSDVDVAVYVEPAALERPGFGIQAASRRSPALGQRRPSFGRSSQRSSWLGVSMAGTQS